MIGDVSINHTTLLSCNMDSMLPWVSQETLQCVWNICDTLGCASIMRQVFLSYTFRCNLSSITEHGVYL